MDLKFPNQNRLDGLTISKISKNKSYLLQQNLHLLAANTPVPMQRLLGQSKSFSVTLIKDTNKQPLNCPIKHLEEEELKVKHQHSIRLTSLTHLCSMKQVFDSHFSTLDFQ